MRRAHPTTTEINKDRVVKRIIDKGYQPSDEGYKPEPHRPGHRPSTSESKPKNPPKKR